MLMACMTIETDDLPVDHQMMKFLSMAQRGCVDWKHIPNLSLPPKWARIWWMETGNWSRMYPNLLQRLASSTSWHQQYLLQVMVQLLVWRMHLSSVKGWMTRQIFWLIRIRPNWVKLQCNRHSRSALKSVLKMANLAPSEKIVLKGRSLTGHLYDI